jgi:hypothetical protein
VYVEEIEQDSVMRISKSMTFVGDGLLCWLVSVKRIRRVLVVFPQDYLFARFHPHFMQSDVNFLGIMQNVWAGAQAFSSFVIILNLLSRLTIFLTKDQTVQPVLYFWREYASRRARRRRLPILRGLGCPNDMAELNAIVGGKEMNFNIRMCRRDGNGQKGIHRD